MRSRLLAGMVLCAATAYPAGAQAHDWTEAQSALQRYDLATASRLCEVARAKQELAEANFCLGRIAFERTQFDAAAAHFKAAATLDSTKSEYFLWIGRAHAERMNDVGIFRLRSVARQSRDAFERAVRLDPANIQARSELMSFFLQAPGLFGGDKKRGAEVARAIAQLNRFQGELARGAVADAEGMDSTAVRILEGLLRDNPDSANAAIALARQHIRHFRCPAAFAVLEAAIHSSPLVYYEVGRSALVCASNLDTGARALRDYAAHVRVHPLPSIPNADWLQARLFERAGLLDSARAAYDRVLLVIPDHRLAQVARARLAKPTSR